MSNDLLPDLVLHKQICSECFLYLSAIPVAVNNKGEKICGRCWSQKKKREHRYRRYHRGRGREGPWSCSKRYNTAEDGVSSLFFTSKYNTVSGLFIFKCINHFEGCQWMLPPHMTLEHEKMCKAEKRECYFCSFKGNFCQIVHHSEQAHPDNFTWDGSLQIPLNINFKENPFSKKVLFVQDNSVYLLTISVAEDMLRIIISVETNHPFIAKQYAIKFSSLKNLNKSDIEFIDYGLFNLKCETNFQKTIRSLQYHFGSQEDQIKLQVLLSQVSVTEKEVEVDRRYENLRKREDMMVRQEQDIGELQRSLVNKKDSLLKERDDHISKLEKELESLQVSQKSIADLIKKISFDFFTCMKCNKIFTESVYFCIKNHCYCANCVTNVCLKCKEITDFKELMDIKNIIVTCDWPKCETKVTLSNYISHKRICELRPYKCPLRECHETVHSSEALRRHWHCKVPDLVYNDYFSHDIHENVITFEEYNNYEFYWLIRNELFHVLIEFSPEKTEILIDETNVVRNNITFHFQGYCSKYNEWNTELDFSSFCGRYKMSYQKPLRGFNLEKIKINWSQQAKFT